MNAYDEPTMCVSVERGRVLDPIGISFGRGAEPIHLSTLHACELLRMLCRAIPLAVHVNMDHVRDTPRRAAEMTAIHESIAREAERRAANLNAVKQALA